MVFATPAMATDSRAAVQLARLSHPADASPPLHTGIHRVQHDTLRRWCNQLHPDELQVALALVPAGPAGIGTFFGPGVEDTRQLYCARDIFQSLCQQEIVRLAGDFLTAGRGAGNPYVQGLFTAAQEVEEIRRTGDAQSINAIAIGAVLGTALTGELRGGLIGGLVGGVVGNALNALSCGQRRMMMEAVGSRFAVPGGAVRMTPTLQSVDQYFDANSGQFAGPDQQVHAYMHALSRQLRQHTGF